MQPHCVVAAQQPSLPAPSPRADVRHKKVSSCRTGKRCQGYSKYMVGCQTVCFNRLLLLCHCHFRTVGTSGTD